MTDEPGWKKALRALGINPVRVDWKLRAWRRGWDRWVASLKNRSQAVTYQHLTVGQRVQRVVSALWPDDRPMVPTLLGAAIVAVYAATVLASRDPDTGSLRGVLGPMPAVLGRYGALDAHAVATGEVQRLLTSAYLHVGLVHIAFNLMSLWTAGTFLEEQIGRAKTFALYTLLAITGGVASYAHYMLLEGGAGGSVGASGAICGLIGVALGYSLRRRNIARHHLGRFVVWAIWIAVIALSGWRIDNYGHAGGLIPGFVIGLLVRRKQDVGQVSKLAWGIAAALAAVVTIAAFIAQSRMS